MKHLLLPTRFLFTLFAALCSATAQQAVVSASSLSIDQLAERAGIIFSGTVQKIDVTEGSVIQVTFTVDEGIRGAFSGQTLILSEWRPSTSAISPYRTGEKVLIFLHAPSQNGLTSPVGGSAGVIRFADPATLKLTVEQVSAVRRSARLRAALPQTTGPDESSVSAADFVRALRLVTHSQ